jgi:hypothetical protein
MKVSEVTKDDMLTLANGLNAMRKLTANGMAMSEVGDVHKALQWLQKLAQDMASFYSSSVKEPQKEAPAEGFKIKEYSPGKPTPKKKK